MAGGKVTNKTVIFGASDLAELLYFHIKKENIHEVTAFTVDSKYLNASMFLGLPLVCSEEIESLFPPENHDIFICVGYKNMNLHRKRAIEHFNAKGYAILNYVHPGAIVDTGQMGIGNLIFQNTTIDAYTTIGDGNILYAGALVAHHSNIGNNNFFAIDSCIAGHVTIGDECFFGAHSTVRHGIEVRDRTLVGANTFISVNTSPDSVWISPKALQVEKKSRDIVI